MLHRLVEQAIWPEKSAWAVTQIKGPEPELFPAEACAISNAVPRRRAEFAFGRHVARRAMAGLGFPDVPVPMGPDRAPQWPPGLHGSISHAEGHCLAVVSKSETVTSLGIDVEPDLPLPEDVIETVCSVTERQRFAQDLRRVFSAKEAVFKALYPECGVVFGFDALEVTESRAQFTCDIGPFPKGKVLPFSQWVGEGWILTLCARHGRAS
ncbi:MAG: 4'-phosphopantetheinyl transferase superfamily protein [Rhodobacteraceae bacterium]|nr:4'-phosphopantetheinyl transferase superfamily protein [Paracoccaceae bacterium]